MSSSSYDFVIKEKAEDRREESNEMAVAPVRRGRYGGENCLSGSLHQFQNGGVKQQYVNDLGGVLVYTRREPTSVIKRGQLRLSSVFKRGESMGISIFVQHERRDERIDIKRGNGRGHADNWCCRIKPAGRLPPVPGK